MKPKIDKAYLAAVRAGTIIPRRREEIWELEMYLRKEWEKKERERLEKESDGR